MSRAISRIVVSLPPVIVRKPVTPSRSWWSSIACARVTSRDEPVAFASWNSGRTPAQTRSARAWRKPGTSRSPSSSICSTSSWVISGSSGSLTRMSVVPITETVRIGTRMSPSAGIVQRLITVFTSRWFIAIMIPLPGMISMSSIPAMSAICARPRARRVEDHPGLDGDLLAAVLVVQARADDGVALAQHVDHAW